MGIFAGEVSLDGSPIGAAAERPLLRAVAGHRRGPCRITRSDGAVFVCQPESPLHFRKGDLRLLAGDSGIYAGFVRLDNRAELADSLRFSGPELNACPDAGLLLRMFERFGAAGIARSLGAFAFAHWDPTARRLILGRDCLGNRALFFHHTGRSILFSNVLGALLALPDVPRAIDETALASFVVGNHREPRRTLYSGIERMPKRSLLTIDRAGIRAEHYWSPDPRPPYKRDADYIERARELFDQAVRAATADGRDVAISLSGGLDSSAVAATAARLGCVDRITGYTLAPPLDLDVGVRPGDYLDDRDKISALARMHPMLDLRILSPEAPHKSQENDLAYIAGASLPALSRTAYGWTAFLTDAVAANGHQLLLHGGRGDYGLSWTGRYSLIEQLRAGEWTAFVRDIAAIARNTRHSVPRTFVADVLLLGGPPGLWRLANRLLGRSPDGFSARGPINPSFLAYADLKRQWREQGFDAWSQLPGKTSVQLRTQLLFDNHPAHQDNAIALDDAYVCDTRDPHADRRVLEFALSVPEQLYRRNGIGRSFARAVFADRLPPEIVDERRRGASGVPWYRWLTPQREKMRAEIERLEHSPIASRLLDLPRLKRLLDDWPADERAAEQRVRDYVMVLDRGIHIGRFIRWVEGGNG